MKTTITVGKQTLEVVCNGATPILFRDIFHRDFIAEFGNYNEKIQDMASKAKDITNLQKDLEEKKITQEQYLERYKVFNMSAEELETINDRNELLQRLAFVMNLQATEDDMNKLVNTNPIKYYEFLSKFERNDLTSNAFTRQITALWKGESDTSIESKN